METKHTKGQWLLNNMSADFVIADVGIHEIVTFDSISNEEHEANAKLIAAAPELLEALISLVNYGAKNYAYHSDSFINELKKCQNAIKKATE